MSLSERSRNSVSFLKIGSYNDSITFFRSISLVSYESVDLSLSIVLWTVRRALCDLVGFSVTSLALFVSQRDYIPATHANSGPLNLLLCLQEWDTTD